LSHLESALPQDALQVFLRGNRSVLQRV